MLIAEILEQVKMLSASERDTLLAALQDMQHPPTIEPQEVHWGKALNRLLDEIGPIEMRYPEIEDPVAWVKHLREQERRQRLGPLADEETTP
jgi:hypothetical protein